MPTSIQKRGTGYVVVEKATGAVKSHHATKAKAQASQRAREGARHGWRPTGKPAKR